MGEHCNAAPACDVCRAVARSVVHDEERLSSLGDDLAERVDHAAEARGGVERRNDDARAIDPSWEAVSLGAIALGHRRDFGTLTGACAKACRSSGGRAVCYSAHGEGAEELG